MLGDFPKCLPRILVYEGGKCDDAHDPGGKTNKGITQATYNMYRREKGLAAADVFNITDAEVSDIYLSHYWAVVAGDMLPEGLDLVVFDGAVNSGPGQSGKWLQHALGAQYVGVPDGIIGGKTLQSVADFCVNSTGVETLINAYCERRLATLQSLTTWKFFGTGWHARIANGEKIADAWAANDHASAPHPVDVTAAGGHQKARIADQKVSPVSQAATHVVTAATSAGALASSASANLAPVQAALPSVHWFPYVLGGLAVASAAAAFLVKTINDVRSQAEKGSATATINLDADFGMPRVPVIDAPEAKAA